MAITNVSASKFKAIDLAYIAIGAALIAVCSWLCIPLTVPFTMQTFGIFFILSALGGRRGTCSVAVYILLGAIGIPVFAEFTSGIGILLGNTGGYMLGFVFIGLIYTAFIRLTGRTLLTESIVLLLGLAVCYAFGTAWFMLLYAKANGAVGLGTVLSWCVLPFIIPDLVKLALALFIAQKIRPMLGIS